MPTESSTRAQSIAHIIWEVKKAEKLCSLSAIAERAGFSAGAKGRSVLTSLKTVKRDWPHLQWWRAVADNGQVEKGSEHATLLVESGFEVEDGDGDFVVIKELESKLMSWEPAEEPVEAEEA